MSRLTIATVVFAVLVAGAGYGWGAVASAQARQAAQALSEAQRVIAEQKTALRASRAAGEALAQRLRAAQSLAQEKQQHDALDQQALAEAKEWADSPVPESIRLRLRKH